jgi:putative DNA-invertase from lambdoid prophage Rac
MSTQNTRVGIYVRVSTLDQSTDLQVKELQAYAASRGWSLISVYDDTGRTGTNTNRPMFKKLLQDARARKLDIVVCWKLDRLARSLKDLVSTLTELGELGVAFVSMRDQIDLTTSTGRLMAHMLGAFAEFEASLIRERVRAGLKNAREKGKALGRPKTRDDAAIGALRSSGLSIRQIATRLNCSIGSVQRSIRR